MNDYEDDIIIMLRKIVALALPKSFEATDDTYRIVLLDKLKDFKEELFYACDDFITAFESLNKNILLKHEESEIWESQHKVFNDVLLQKKESLLEECKKNSININYEINKLLE